VLKPTPRNLRYFSRTPYARRAINAIKNPIAMLGWEIVPVDGGVDLNSGARAPDRGRHSRCLRQSERTTTASETLVEQVVEDMLCGAGHSRQQLGGDALRPLWMWPVDGLSIQIFPAWSGDPSEARYTQSIGYGGLSAAAGTSVQLRDDELIYIKPNPSTSTPFGLLARWRWRSTRSRRQLGVGRIRRQRGVQRPARGSCSTSARAPREGGFRPSAATGQTRSRGRARSRSSRPRAARSTSSILTATPRLYLKWQEFLKVEIATAFDLSPQNLGVERDVNRSTGEVAEDRDWDQAIKPWARKLSSAFTKVIRTRLLFSQLEFRFVGLDREDEQATAEIYATEYEANAIVPNEYRARRGLPPMESEWGEMTYADMQIAIKAAQGAAAVLDDDLNSRQPAMPKPGAKES
jgi:hypothetical protein